MDILSAIEQLSEEQKAKAEHSRLRSHTAAVRDWFQHVNDIKQAIKNDDLFYVAQLWEEIEVTNEKGERDIEATKALHTRLFSMSTTDGGLWTTKERNLIRQAWAL